MWIFQRQGRLPVRMRNCIQFLYAIIKFLIKILNLHFPNYHALTFAQQQKKSPNKQYITVQYNKYQTHPSPMLQKLPLQFPLLVCAPMVEQSELPFRMLTRKYGANLCYTPMLHSKMMTTQKKYKQEHFTTCAGDRPLVAQICGNDPETMVKAAKMLEGEVDAIDVNFGCPQAIAKRGHYGSYLLQSPDTVYNVVKALTQNIKVPIFCKIRIRKTEQKTFQIVDRIIKAGCSLLTVHGRTKQQNKQRVGACDWAMIKKIKEYVTIPVIANGGIYGYEDVERCLVETGADGVMSAEALLENPALFSGKKYCLDTLALQYLALTEQYPGADISCIRAHLFKMLYRGLSENIDLRQAMVKIHTVPEFRALVTELKERRLGKSVEEKFGWYQRYWAKCYVEPGTKRIDSGEAREEEANNEQKKEEHKKDKIEQKVQECQQGQQCNVKQF